MDETAPPPEPDSLSASPTSAARRSRAWPWLLLLALTFVAGVVLTVLALPYLQHWRGEEAAPSSTGAATPATAASRGALPPSAPALTNNAAQMLDGRIAQLEERLNRITVEAQAASGNAGRAEGLLVAFAARRALDSGAPLGYIEGQLRLRFGQAQPRAVATIINAAREPITLGDLRVGLTDIVTDLTKPPAQDWWDALSHEAQELVTIRRTSTPSPRPEMAYERALHYVDAGRVGAALAEVERMPGRAAAERWMQLARRYVEARRAIDLIETAAILEPRQFRPADGLAPTETSGSAP